MTLPFPEEKGVDTIYKLSKRAFGKWGEKKCMGTRTYKGQKSEKVKEFGETNWKTYEEVRSIEP
jgi:hypothetical protein